MKYNLNGRTAVITGGSQGLGKKIAEEMVNSGASVMICARNEEKLEIAKQELMSCAKKSQIISSYVCNVANQNDVKGLFEKTIQVLGNCNILVNNAGVYGPKGFTEDNDWDEWIRAFEVNLIGSVLTCRAFIPHFKGQGYGKIIQLSGGGATSPLPMLTAYASSKAAVVRYIETISEELSKYAIDANSVAPGALNTRLLDEILDAGPEMVGEDFYKRSLKQMENGGGCFITASELICFLASNESDGISGKLISAVWDNWDKFPGAISDIQKSNVLTLRRIVGSNVDMNWIDK